MKQSNNGNGPVVSLCGMGRQAVTRAIAKAARHTHAPVLAVDGTCGNGHDTHFLAEALHAEFSGRSFQVLAFDLQEQALANTARMLAANNLRQHVSLLRQSHDTLAETLDSLTMDGEEPLLVAAMYNLGFLPGSDKSVTTQTSSTLASVAQAASALAPGGVVAIHAYGGHAGGKKELDAVDDWCARLDFSFWLTARYAFCNKPRNPETLFLIQKRERI